MRLVKEVLPPRTPSRREQSHEWSSDKFIFWGSLSITVAIGVINELIRALL